MIVIMSTQAREDQIASVEEKLESLGFGVHLSSGVERTILGAIGGDKSKIDVEQLQSLPGVERVVHVMEPYKLVSRVFHPEKTVVEVKGIPVGAKEVAIIAGPCAVENFKTLENTAKSVKAAGASILRGGSFKPRTSPYSFQGHGLEGLKMLAAVGKSCAMPVVSEVMDTRDVEIVAEYVDLLQIGARNAQNFPLLKEVGQAGKPVLLKRGMNCTFEDWLLAAEYIASSGNTQITLGERGIRTFETYTRNTLDLSSVPVINKLSHLPVLVDPSHATGASELVPAMAKAAVASGADAIMIEVHHNPSAAWCDGRQSLNCEQFAELVSELSQISKAIGRSLVS